MEIKHASLEQIRRGRDGRTVRITGDVLDVLKQIQEIHPGLYINWHEAGDYYSVVEECKDGWDRIVTTVTELDQRLIDHVRRIDSHRQGWDVGAEIARQDREAAKGLDHGFKEKLGVAGEKLHHAIRKDLGVKNRIWVPR